MKKSYPRKVFPAIAACVFILSGLCGAVTSQVVRHSSAADFLKGQTEKTIIG